MIRARARQPGDPRSAAAAALSFLFPGVGQAYNRNWALAALLAAPALVAMVFLVILLVVARGPSDLLSRLLDTQVLAGLIVLDLALLVWRLVAIVQAHVARSPLRLPAWPTWLTAGLVVITIGMHALPAYYATKAIDTLGSIALEGGGSLFDGRGARDVPITAPSFQPEVGRGERVTVLLVGVDFAPGRTTHLTDTMLVATFDPASGGAALVSVPRDLYGTPLGDGRVYNAKLNSLLSTASGDPATYPLGGPATLKAAIGALLDTRVHYFAAIDIEGMRELIDIVGGVDVMVERTIDDPMYADAVTGQRGFYLPAGSHHLDGATAMAYVRSRLGAGDSDFTRAARQQQVLTAIASKLTASDLLLTLPGLLDAVKGNVSTDIPSSRIPPIAAEAEAINLAEIERFVLTPEDGYVTVEAHSAAGYILRPDLDAIQALGRRVFGSRISDQP